MITLESINLFFETYKRNYTIFCEWNDRIYQSENQQVWTQRLYERAQEISRLFEENTLLFHDILDPILRDPDQLCAEGYDLLYTWTKDMYFQNYDDPFVDLRLAHYLLSHYEALQDLERIPFLYLLLGYANIEISRTGDHRAGEASVYYYRKLTELRTHFSAFQDEQNRTSIFTAYCNLILTEHPLQNLDWRSTHRLYLEFRDWHNQPEILSFYDQNPRLGVLADGIRREYCGTTMKQALDEDPTPLEQLKSDPMFQEVIDITQDFYADLRAEAPDYPDFSIEQVLFGYEFLLEAGQITPVEVWKIADAVCTWKKPPAALMDIDPVGVIINPLSELYYLLSLTPFSEEEKVRLSAPHRREVIEFIRNFPSGIYSYSINTGLRNICQDPLVLGSIPTGREKEAFICELMVARHLSTYIHSIIVGRLSMAVLEYVIVHRPQLLLHVSIADLFSLDSVEIIREKKEVLLDYIYRASLLHDIGKNGLVDIINTEYRRIGDPEFSIIQMHPQQGATFLEADRDLQRYHAIVLGHHKSYDGKSGYPAYFDNVHSPVRFLIDVVSICDTLEAATDRLGRNYHRAKNFEQISAELREGAGTRYHPDIVALIEEQPQLRSRLQSLLGSEREQIYFEVYQKFFVRE